MDGKNNGSFWPSYVDIMTTLFAITLILFAVSFSRFKIKERQLQLLVNEYEDIINVYSTMRAGSDTDIVFSLPVTAVMDTGQAEIRNFVLRIAM